MPILGRKSGADVVNRIGRKSGIPLITFGGKYNAGKRITTTPASLFEGGNKKSSDLER